MDVTIRDAAVDDLYEYLRLRVELGVDDPAPSALAWERRMVPSMQIAERDGRVVGFVMCERFGQLGFVRQIVSDPTVRRQGLGRRLMHAAAARLRTAGALRWQLNVKPDNAAALGLYRSLGLQRHHDSAAVRFAWTQVPELPGGSLAVTELPAKRDAEVEQSFAQPHGWFAGYRDRSAGSGVLCCELDGAVRGLAAFDAGFSGAYPFRASDAEVAASLLRAMHARRALDGRDVVQVMVEDDAALEACALGWGGRVVLRIQSHAGPLPAV